MTGALLAGALIGIGLTLLVMALVRPQPRLATMVARIDAGRRSMSTTTLTGLEAAALGRTAPGRTAPGRTAPGRAPSSGGGSEPVPASGVDAMFDRLRDRMEVVAAERGWQLGRQRSDLAVMNRTAGWLLATKTVAGLGLLLVAPLCWTLLRVMGIALPTAIPLVVALALGALGFFLPDLILRSEADRRRREFRRTVGIFLDLVAMNLAGGRGLPEALLAAATISEHWSLVRIRQALANARLFGITPWQSLGALGTELGVEELRDMAGALALAADDGAKIRTSLAARAATLRRKELSDAEGEAGERSQSMLVAQLLICTAFLVFLAYPAVARLLAA